VSASEFQTREAIVGKAVALACEAARQSTVGRVVSIGDGIWDLKTARNFGYEFVGIGSMEKAAALEELGAIVYRDIT
jgi:phosphoglycolate phosphatase-like HAD superfamily hydrolase